MFKISKKIQFSSDENKMNSIANTKIARDLYYSSKYQNVKFLLRKRFSWMNHFINDNEKGIEVPCSIDIRDPFNLPDISPL